MGFFQNKKFIIIVIKTNNRKIDFRKKKKKKKNYQNYIKSRYLFIYFSAAAKNETHSKYKNFR